MDRAKKRISTADERFVAGIAHELKSPLSAMFGYADILLDTPLGEGLSDKQREIIGKIRSTALRAVDLVKNYQYLALKKLDSEGTCDLTSVISSVVEGTVREHPPVPPIQWNLLPQPLLILGVPSLVERVISNLLSNALKFTPPEGSITVSTHITPHGIACTVHNSNAFVDAHSRKHLFDLYTRGSNAALVPGAGVGLFVVKTVCKALKASVKVESDETNGTTFTVTFRAVP